MAYSSNFGTSAAQAVRRVGGGKFSWEPESARDPEVLDRLRAVNGGFSWEQIAERGAARNKALMDEFSVMEPVLPPIHGWQQGNLAGQLRYGGGTAPMGYFEPPAAPPQGVQYRKRFDPMAVFRSLGENAFGADYMAAKADEDFLARQGGRVSFAAPEGEGFASREDVRDATEIMRNPREKLREKAGDIYMKAVWGLGSGNGVMVEQYPSRDTALFGRGAAYRQALGLDPGTVERQTPMGYGPLDDPAWAAQHKGGNITFRGPEDLQYAGHELAHQHTGGLGGQGPGSDLELGAEIGQDILDYYTKYGTYPTSARQLLAGLGKEDFGAYGEGGRLRRALRGGRGRANRRERVFEALAKAAGIPTGYANPASVG